LITFDSILGLVNDIYKLLFEGFEFVAVTVLLLSFPLLGLLLSLFEIILLSGFLFDAPGVAGSTFLVEI
jgi:hypothetical protein